MTDTSGQAKHPATQHLLDLFEYKHLPPHLQEVSKQLAETAAFLTGLLGEGPELTTGLRKLLEAKDCFVRQAVIDARTVRHFGGKPVHAAPQR